jgi:hypothetical protein
MATEIDIETLAKTIFSNEIKNPNSYVITFDNIPLIELFQSLLYILAEGCKYMYTKDDNKNIITDLDYTDFTDLHKYFLSFGINLTLAIMDSLPQDYINYDNYPINSQTALKELCYMIKCQRIFICSFAIAL